MIENIGTTVARNVRFDFDPPLKSAREVSPEPITEAKIIKDGISMIPPGRRYELLFDLAPDRAGSTLDMLYSVTVHCDGPHGPVEPIHYEIDISVLFGWSYHSAKTVHDGVKILEKLQKDLSKVQTDLRALMRRMESSDD